MAKPFTYTLTAGNSIEFKKSESFTKISVRNNKDSAGNGTMLGADIKPIGGVSSTIVQIEPGNGFSFVSENAIDGGIEVTIEALSGATLYIVAER